MLRFGKVEIESNIIASGRLEAIWDPKIGPQNELEPGAEPGESGGGEPNSLKLAPGNPQATQQRAKRGTTGPKKGLERAKT